MSAARIVSWLSLSALVLGLSGGCKGDGSNVDRLTGGGTGGGPVTDLDLGLGEGGGGDVAGAPSAAGPVASDCEDFAGLEQCGVTSVEATFSAANVLLVMDKSSSMDDQPAGFELKKWDALKAALEPALRAAEERVNFGLVLYPFDEQQAIPLDCYEGCCAMPDGSAAIRVDIDPSVGTSSKIIEALDAAAPGGGTPTAAALDAALTYFEAGAGKHLQGDRFVLLATDGGPNCGTNDAVCDPDHCTPNLDGLCPSTVENCCVGEGSYCLDDAAVVEKLQALAAIGVATFVVGIPGTERYADYLNAFATAGGVPRSGKPPYYYAVSAEGGVEELARTFADVTTHLVRSCSIELGGNVRDKKLLNVAVDCEVVPFADGDGWDVDPKDSARLVLGSEACDRVEQVGARRIDVVYGCQTVK